MNEIFLSAVLRKARRDRGREDTIWFSQYYLSHILENKTPLFHLEIFKLLKKEKRLGIAAPRGFAKSTIVQLLYGIHCLLYNENEDILTISQSASLAEDWLRKIKFELEGNEKIKNDFGPILKWGEKDSKRWTSSHLIIQKEGRVFSQIRARGRGCQVRGLRPTKVICDDLEDEELVRSEEQRKYLEEWFLGALLNVLKMDQQLVVIGTLLHPLALLTKIINKKEHFEGWTTEKYKAIDNNKSLWEERFPIEDLLKRKMEIGTYAFETEFQNNPISSDICLWRPGWIKRYDKITTQITKVFAALDPASSEKESSDHSAIVVLGVGEDNNIYELSSVKGRWGTWDLIERIIATNVSYRPIRFGIEEGVLQNIIAPVLLKKTELDPSLRVPFEKISLGRYTGEERKRREPKDKYSRALSVIHLWEQGVIFLKNQDLIDQLSTFPTGSEDDLVDACVYCARLIQKYSPIKIMVQKQKQTTASFGIKENTLPLLVDFNPTNIGRDWRIGG